MGKNEGNFGVNQWFWRLVYKVVKPWNHLLSDRFFISLQYRIVCNEKLNFNTPIKFSEKLQWLKLYDHKEYYSLLVDKIEAKKWVAKRLGKAYTIETLKVWDRAADISFDELPDKFVLKCSHNSGGVTVCTNKSALNKESIIKEYKRLLKENYYYAGREWPYKNVKPRILAERYITENPDSPLTDYKFYCFNGDPRFLYISQTDPEHKDTPITYLDTHWNMTPFHRKNHRLLEPLPPRPENFDEMLNICRNLSSNIPFVRVDLYNIEGNIYFSELTFFPASGYNTFEPKEWDRTIGDYLELPTNQ